ncbi:MAG: electron transport complex subunit RsxC, partial [Clostridia bacterium]|nr:electron transport complex subunit RsxC [Clostridia bacterium]
MGKTSMKGVLNPVKKVKGGVLVSHHKNTADMKVVRIPTPEKIVMPMQQHIGAPCIPTVKIGETVSVGQVIGDSDAYVSAPIHSSISGKVLSMDDVTLPNGIISKAITIESDGEMRLFEGIKPPK